MNRNEVATLLGRIAITDGRTVDATTILDWTQILPQWIPLPLALRAVIEHRRDTPDWLEPAHIIRWSKHLQNLDVEEPAPNVGELLQTPANAITLRQYLDRHPEQRPIVDRFRRKSQ